MHQAEDAPASQIDWLPQDHNNSPPRTFIIIVMNTSKRIPCVISLLITP